jgi:hypothetical protein
VKWPKLTFAKKRKKRSGNSLLQHSMNFAAHMRSKGNWQQLILHIIMDYRKGRIGFKRQWILFEHGDRMATDFPLLYFFLHPSLLVLLARARRLINFAVSKKKNVVMKRCTKEVFMTRSSELGKLCLRFLHCYLRISHLKKYGIVWNYICP